MWGAYLTEGKQRCWEVSGESRILCYLKVNREKGVLLSSTIYSLIEGKFLGGLTILPFTVFCDLTEKKLSKPVRRLNGFADPSLKGTDFH